MIGALISYVAAVALALLAGWVLPTWAIRRLVPMLRASGLLVTNYRGRDIPSGLGLVWIVWSASVAAAVAVVSLAVRMVPPDASPTLIRIAGGRELGVAELMPILLVIGSACFGLIDDIYGSGSAKGFSGHLRALRSGRLSTGGLKVLGIGSLAMVAALGRPEFREPFASALEASSSTRLLAAIAAWVCATLIISLSANFINLTDLRPGRASKAYGLLVVVAVLLYGAKLLSGVTAAGLFTAFGALLILDAVVSAACLAILLLGPIAAIWPYDLGERAMLGDSGANAMGALAGFFLAFSSPLWLMVVLALVLLALNLVSERISFSKVIDRVGFLKRMDGLGRLSVRSLREGSEQYGDDGEWAGGPAVEGDDARKDGGTSPR